MVFMSQIQSQDRKLMKYASGQNRVFQNTSVLMCFCNYGTGYFLTLMTQSVRHVIELMFKVHIRTKVYYCFNSKGDNFDVKQLYHTTKN